MKIVIVSTLIAYALAGSHPVNHEIVAEIKAKATWTPMEPEENPFAYMPVEQIKAMMGTKIQVGEETAVETDEDLSLDVPNDFDSREEWGDKIHPIRNQGKCGSCWAFGASEAFSDRLAIAGVTDAVLSPQYLVSCDKANLGCNGGYLNKVWDFLHSNGVPTDDCYASTSDETGKTGTCESTCDDGSKLTLYKSEGTQSAFSFLTSKAQKAIQKDGPIEAAFSVYEDFMSYKSGVYQHTSGSLLGGHAIKCIGWGTEGKVDYWLMANSWGPEWGDNGFFKIKRGDCGSNGQLYWAEVPKSMTTTE